MKKIRNILLLFVVIGLIAGCGNQANKSSGNSSEKSSGTVKMRSADVVDINSPYTKGMEEFAKDINSATDGKLSLEHFPAGQLGNDSQILESVKQGSIDFGLQGAIPGSAVAGAFYLPYLFQDADHLKAVIFGSTGDKIKAKIEEETGVKVIGFVPFAARMLTTNGVEVKTPEDLKGLKIRVPESPAVIEAWKELGANPTPLSFTELFTSLQTGVVDGQENPYEIILNNSFYEVQDTLNETYHNFPVRTLIMNKEKYESLTADQQKALEETWVEAAKSIDKMYSEQEAGYKEQLLEKGMKFVESDIESFAAKSRKVTDKLGTEIFGEEIYQEIVELRK
ncbi:TRAP transporter substrate-binding protein [Neobacillus niacini]|uniref:TRAP transporter substrate-binding protein n=1 Tax=Neobacillus niacini TaxID=86668 RepID=UPI00203E82CF|nr:TRAP transporter substrate-binding protein [Neobacillus niacini]MCM3691931.1 TRAP transporter substrate-binding protein [Neobacillus niacini]